MILKSWAFRISRKFNILKIRIYVMRRKEIFPFWLKANISFVYWYFTTKIEVQEGHLLIVFVLYLSSKFIGEKSQTTGHSLGTARYIKVKLIELEKYYCTTKTSALNLQNLLVNMVLFWIYFPFFTLISNRI